MSTALSRRISMNPAKYLACLLVLVLGNGCAQTLFAQGTDLGAIRGSVTDSTGAVIPNAKVVVVDLATNTSRETATNPDGDCIEWQRCGECQRGAESCREGGVARSNG